MDFTRVNEGLLQFLDESPVAFYAVKNMRRMLEEAGAERLCEGEAWKLETGKKYYVTRNESAIIAFEIPKKDYRGFQIMASHSDSPVFKIKANAEIEVDKTYVKLNVEKYGGMIFSPWLDRPLSVAGRVIIETPEGIETRLVRIDRDLVIIPNLAIHMNREINDGYKFNAQNDMLPLFGEKLEKGSFLRFIAKEAGVEES
ncbi:MAG: M18 family aminopeptidase, partial [Clostridium sp.]|nr:M18 family aminopeptidase [Clostridium sp.]